MSFPEPSSNGNGSGSNLQRIAIGAGTLIVVILTVIIAIFLTVQDLPPGGEPVTPITSPTSIAGVTAAPTFTLTSPASLVTDTPLPPATATATPPPTATPANTNTPLPPSPTFTVAPPPPATPTLPPAQPAEPPPPGPCQPPANWVSYTVQVGDTFNSLAGRTGMTVADLVEVNCPQNFTLQPGQVIYLPFTPPTLTPTPLPSATAPPAATVTRSPTPISPEITSVTPRQVSEEYEQFFITVIGRNFRPREAGFRVELRGPQMVQLQLREVTLSETGFDALVLPGLPRGTYDLVVTNQNGQTGVRSGALSIGPVTPTPVIPQPEITDVEPESGVNDRERIIAVRGRNFQPNDSGFRVELRAGSFVEGLVVVGTASSTSFDARVPAGLPADQYDLWVINPDGQEDVEPAAYESLNP